jgi:DUF1680 family protein
LCQVPARLNLRVPTWSGEGATVQVNGETLELQARPGMYMQVAWQWTARDVVKATFPARVWVEPLRDVDKSYASMHAVMYGPLVLAGCVSSR